MKPTPEQIAKLPKWAQEYIATMESRERNAIKALDELKGGRPDSPIQVERSTDPSDKRYESAYRVPGNCVRLYLDRNEPERWIEVNLSGKHSQTAAWRGRSIEVRGSNALAFRASASNVLEVTDDYNI